MLRNNKSSKTAKTKTLIMTPKKKPMPENILDAISDSLIHEEKIGINTPNIFKRKHVLGIVKRIKLSMNHRDNKIAHNIMKAMQYRNSSKQEVYRMGICSKEYIMDYPKYTHMYRRKVEEAILDETRRLKNTLVKKNVIGMLQKQPLDMGVEERPFLYRTTFNIANFLKARNMASIADVAKKSDKSAWEVCKVIDDPTILQSNLKTYLDCGGDEKVKNIMDRGEKSKVWKSSNRHRKLKKANEFFPTSVPIPTPFS